MNHVEVKFNDLMSKMSAYQPMRRGSYGKSRAGPLKRKIVSKNHAVVS
jgi:hypothetical protein